MSRAALRAFATHILLFAWPFTMFAWRPSLKYIMHLVHCPANASASCIKPIAETAERKKPKMMVVASFRGDMKILISFSIWLSRYLIGIKGYSPKSKNRKSFFGFFIFPQFDLLWSFAFDQMPWAEFSARVRRREQGTNEDGGRIEF